MVVGALAAVAGAGLAAMGLVAVLWPTAVREGYAEGPAAVPAATALSTGAWRLAGATLVLAGAALVLVSRGAV